MDFDRAFRIGDDGRGAQLQPENGASKGHSVAVRAARKRKTLSRSLRLNQRDEILQFEYRFGILAARAGPGRNCVESDVGK